MENIIKALFRLDSDFGGKIFIGLFKSDIALNEALENDKAEVKHNFLSSVSDLPENTDFYEDDEYIIEYFDYDKLR